MPRSAGENDANSNAAGEERVWSRKRRMNSSAASVIDPPRPDLDLCKVSSVCSTLAQVDVDSCASGRCWITETQFVDLFSDLANWTATPPFSDAGIVILQAHGIVFDRTDRLISVDATNLREKLRLSAETASPKFDPEEISINPNVMGTCAGLMRRCQGTALDHLPNLRFRLKADGLLCERARPHHGQLSGLDCRPRYEAQWIDPQFRVGIHFGGATDNSQIPQFALEGWPAGVG
jgi:hypothetical protein